ncbi:Ig-like domain-containing protein, partial [Flavobacterium filum]|uniref:Ig-like domain-containing protein n=1 Tax=Flavobacterium filum TaxID=370974 RepID=UPI0023F36269
MKFLKFSFVIILINSCANIVSLTGGKDDTQVPVLIKKNYDSIHFNQKKIELKFNEYVTLNQPEKNITLQPSHSTLKFKTLQKSVIIELDSQLKNNTTYVLTIDKGIQDNNANNPFSFTSVFSTGGQLDTGIIKVKLLNDLEQIKNIKIALTNSSGIDSFKSFKPDYIYSMTNNQIAFNGLSNKLYNIWSFYDDDNNNIPDVYKPIDFRLNALIDSNYILMLKEWKKPLYIKNLILDKN